MDQNLDYNGLPSEEELQRLANAYFSEPPTEGLGISPQQAVEPSVISNHLQNQGNFSDLNTFDQANSISGYQNSIPVSKNMEYGNLPSSVTGNGASPSVVEKQHTFDIDDPQTSLLDPHFEEGKIPKSVGGSGISPSLAKKENQTPHTSVESELKKVLNEIISFVPSSQLPEG